MLTLLALLEFLELDSQIGTQNSGRFPQDVTQQAFSEKRCPTSDAIICATCSLQPSHQTSPRDRWTDSSFITQITKIVIKNILVAEQTQNGLFKT